jgi:tripartite-type tricarboxylate transporter receptor subunit TctC
MNFSLNRRQALAAAAALAVGASARAQGNTALRLVVTFPPGGSTDIAARILQPELGKRLGRPVIVDNKPGAAGQIATALVAKAPADGNTLLVSFDTHAINPVAKPHLPYDTFKDFAGVTLAVRFPLVIGASPSVPANDLRGLIDAARKKPGQYSYASTGLGSMNQLVMEEIKRKSDVSLLHVPYTGAGPALQAVLGDVSQLTALSYAALRGQIAAGKIKPLAVTGTRRLPELPNVPTVAESGFPGFQAYSWVGIFSPQGTPPDTLRQLTEAFRATLRSPDVHRRLEEAGFEVMASDGPTVERHARAEYERWSAFVRDARLKLEN